MRTGSNLNRHWNVLFPAFANQRKLSSVMLGLGIFSIIFFWGSLQLLAVLEFLFLIEGLIRWDLRYLLLPDFLIEMLLVSGFLWNSEGLFVPLMASFEGAMGAYVFFGGLYYVSRFVLGKEGLGWGDVKLASALGAWFGWEAFPWILCFSGTIGLCFSPFWQSFSFQKDRIPFAPALLLSGWMQFFWSNFVLGSYPAP